MQSNRSLRATAIIICGWVGLRTSFLLMSSDAEISKPVTGASVHQSKAPLPITTAVVDSGAIAPSEMARSAVRTNKIKSSITKSDALVVATETNMQIVQAPVAGLLSESGRTATPSQTSLPTPPRSPDVSPGSARFSNLSISAWAILRPAGAGLNLATNGQLGASQAGIRVQQPLLHIGRRLPIAFNLRVSAPLDQKLGREAGIGLGTRPVKQLPVELILERRVALDRGGRNAFAVIAAGGFNDKRLVNKMSLSGYAQTGIVGFTRGDRFVDGALQIERALLDRNDTGLRLGAGIWGAAQPSVTRIDVGPILTVKQRLGTANLRISAEYRWRVAGQARPASGPALSIGTDF